MGYGPGVLDTLHRQYTLLHDTLINKGVNVWYGEAGDDREVAKMLLDGRSYEDIAEYLIDNYTEGEEDW